MTEKKSFLSFDKEVEVFMENEKLWLQGTCSYGNLPEWLSNKVQNSGKPLLQPAQIK